MTKGISFQGFVPMRREPSRASEMRSQVLFGETFRIFETGRGWCYISLDFDGFEGWVSADSIQTYESDERAETAPEDDIRMVTLPSVGVLDLERARPLILPAGSLWKSTSGKSMTIQGRNFEVLSEKVL